MLQRFGGGGEVRILLVHNFYGSTSPSGENAVVEEERDLLRAGGHEVLEHFVSSDWIREGGRMRLLRTGLLAPWNPGARAEVRRKILRFAPDIVHVHNVFPLLSPSVFSAAEGTGAAVVATLHNYRTVCPAAVLLRDGKPCEACVRTRSVIPAVRYGCYKASRLMTLPVAAGVALHRWLKTYDRHVDAHIALTAFQKEQLVRGGLPENKIHVKPSSFNGVCRPVPWRERESKVVFVGRISSEKGLDSLLEAWRLWGDAAPQLEIVGDGPDLERLRAAAGGGLSSKVSFTGRKPQPEAHALMARAKLLALPSIWFEGFPLALREAFAFGVPVAASRIGPFEELVEKTGAGRCFNPGDPASIYGIIAEAWRNDSELDQMGRMAFREYQTRYSRQEGLAGLERVYQWAMEIRRLRLSGWAQDAISRAAR